MLYRYIKIDDEFLQKEVSFQKFYEKIKNHVENGGSFSLATIAKFACCSTLTVRNHLKRKEEFREFVAEMQAINHSNIEQNINTAGMASKDTDGKLLLHQLKKATIDDKLIDGELPAGFNDNFSKSKTVADKLQVVTNYYTNNRITLEQYNSIVNSLKIIREDQGSNDGASSYALLPSNGRIAVTHDVAPNILELMKKNADG